MPEGEEHMGKTAHRVGALGFVVAASAGLFFTNSASAAPGPDPLLKGDCEATVSAKDGTPVTVDVGALVNRPGAVDLGLGTKSTNATGGKPLLNLPVTDALDALGITKVPGLRDVTTGVCKPVQTLANKAAGGVQALAAPVTGDDNLPSQPPGDNPPAWTRARPWTGSGSWSQPGTCPEAWWR
ncbi:hypothetical protein [Amycolatopsis sp. CA-230715]|uniref:hypothetical protein n=1 Tax=Amycolatopsis sp. CA-230715 TaxID=2745196 RepID=UPI001C0187E5|nr:hypothetical protein [Amycolatopsis sp. CA-230715]QWF80545.1 hypothetical protein HUW46_03968 [Amycolatopsis sp. CA-230715]